MKNINCLLSMSPRRWKYIHTYVKCSEEKSSACHLSNTCSMFRGEQERSETLATPGSNSRSYSVLLHVHVVILTHLCNTPSAHGIYYLPL